MIELIKYSADCQKQWNAVVAGSRNGTFLFDRAYMDYHASTYSDHSFLVRKKNKVEAVIPGNAAGTVFYSHQGLTYGGVISTENITVTDMLEIFGALNELLRRDGFASVVYKPVPALYHSMPAEEDLYALFRTHARLLSRQISSVILQANKLPFSESRKSGLRKAMRSGVQIRESEDYGAFWGILNEVLASRHGARPVHTLEEIELLHQRFPRNIRLHVAVRGDAIVAGVVIYLSETVAHVQYIATTEDGKQCGALDLIFNKLINEVYAATPAFEFGTSTRNGGLILNEPLIFQKEGFGGRGVVYDAYEYAL